MVRGKIKLKITILLTATTRVAAQTVDSWARGDPKIHACYTTLYILEGSHSPHTEPKRHFTSPPTDYTGLHSLHSVSGQLRPTS